MANEEQLALLKQGAEQWNKWRSQYPEIRPNLKDANMFEDYLFEADLSNADLTGANLSFTDLTGALLKDANLSFANLIGANLSRANLAGANLSIADLTEANLTGTDLSRSNTSQTIFAQVDLRDTKGLTKIAHMGPSRIELHTIQLPQDGSALHFLRGAGVPDEWIDFWRTTMANPIQYHSLFVSYSSKDDTLARRLHADLQAHGVRCWFAPEDMKIGDRFHARINEAIHIQDKLLLLLSKHAIQSNWVEIEVRAALEKEHRQNRNVLFPVCLDSSVRETSQAWAAMLRQSRHIGDFTNWTDPQAYQQAFERLLRDLKKANEQQG